MIIGQACLLLQQQKSESGNRRKMGFHFLSFTARYAATAAQTLPKKAMAVGKILVYIRD